MAKKKKVKATNPYAKLTRKQMLSGIADLQHHEAENLRMIASLRSEIDKKNKHINYLSTHAKERDLAHQEELQEFVDAHNTEIKKAHAKIDELSSPGYVSIHKGELQELQKTKEQFEAIRARFQSQTGGRCLEDFIDGLSSEQLIEAFTSETNTDLERQKKEIDRLSGQVRDLLDQRVKDEALIEKLRAAPLPKQATPETESKLLFCQKVLQAIQRLVNEGDVDHVQK